MRDAGSAEVTEKADFSKSSRPHLRAMAYFALLTFLFFAPAWLTGRNYGASDFLYRTPLWYDPGVKLQNFDLFDAIIFFYPDYDYLNKSLKGGEFPFWNPYNLGGRPVAFNGSSGYFYPPRLLLHSVLSTAQASTAILVLHIFAAGFFMYLLSSRLHLSFPAALFVGTAWMFNGWSVTWLLMEHGPVFSALLPLGLLALRLSLRNWRGTAALACVIGLTVVAGHLQLTYYCWAIMVFVGAYFVFSQPRIRWLGSTVRVGSGFVLGVLLSAPLLVPTVAALLGSQRPTLSLAFLQTIYRESLATGVPTFIFPDLFGNPADNFSLLRIPSGGYFIYPELCAYVGVASLFLFARCFWLRGFPKYVSWLALTALVLPATPLYQLVFWLPGVNRINSTRLVFFWMFFVALGSGFGLDALTQRSRRWLSAAAGTAMILWLGLIAYLNSGDPRLTLVKWLQEGKIRLPDPQLYLTKQEHFAAALAGFQATYGWGSWAVLAPLIWLGLFILALRFQARTAWLLVGLLAIDVITFGVRFNPKVQSTSVFETNSTVRFLKEHAGLDRVMGIGTIKPNSLLPFELYDAGGYDAFYPSSSGRYFTFLIHGEKSLDSGSLAQAFPITNYASPLVNLLGVRYFVAYPGQELPGYTKVVDAPLPIFENPRRLPRAFVTSSYLVKPDPGETLRLLASGKIDPGKTVLLAQEPPQQLATPAEPTSSTEVEIVSYRPHEVHVLVRGAPNSSWLVLTDAFADGWTAEVNGKPSPIFQAHLMFRAVPLLSETQDYEIIFRYAPPRFSTGIALFYFALSVVLVLFFFAPRVATTADDA